MKVFISHAQKDAALAQKLSSVLREAGLDVWGGMEEILPGENWAERVAKALTESEAMIVLLTPEALASSNVMLEIGYALGQKSYDQRLIPIIVGNPEKIPEEKIPWILRHLKMIRLPAQDKDEESLKQIALALKEVA